MKELLVFFGTILVTLATACGFNYANKVENNHAIEALVQKGVPAFEAKCIITPSVQCEAILGVLKAKGD